MAEPEEVRTLQSLDWLEALGDFPAALVAESCGIWMRAEPNKRPTPGHIRALCVEAMPKRQPKPTGAPQIEQVQHSPDTVRDNWKSLPFPSLTHAEQELFNANMPRRLQQDPERPAEPRPQLSDFKTQPYPDQEGLAKEALAALDRRRMG